jgi:hypothetical protein
VIGAVMGSDQIGVREVDGQLELSGGVKDRILLAPA